MSWTTRLRPLTARACWKGGVPPPFRPGSQLTARLRAPSYVPRRGLASKELQTTEQPAHRPDFDSILSQPPLLVRIGRRHGKGLILLGESTLSMRGPG